MMLSEIPSPRYSLSASPETLVNGSTASESSGRRPEGVVTTGVSTPANGDRAGSLVATGAPDWLAANFDPREDGDIDGAGCGAGAGLGTERVNTVRTRFHSDSVRRRAIVAEPRLSARENSAAEANRSFGSFAIARTSAQLTCSGTSAR